MSRTDEVRGRGQTRKSVGGGDTPFVRWPDKYSWIEGKVVGSFATKYGLAVTLKLDRFGGAEAIGQGRDEDGNNFEVNLEPGMEINVGTGSKLLAGTILAEDEGRTFHIAFEGWEHPKGGNRYRVFTVIALDDREPVSAPAPASDEPVPEDTRDYSHGDPDDDLPF